MLCVSFLTVSLFDLELSLVGGHGLVMSCLSISIVVELRVCWWWSCCWMKVLCDGWLDRTGHGGVIFEADVYCCSCLLDPFIVCRLVDITCWYLVVDVYIIILY